MFANLGSLTFAYALGVLHDAERVGKSERAEVREHVAEAGMSAGFGNMFANSSSRVRPGARAGPSDRVGLFRLQVALQIVRGLRLLALGDVPPADEHFLARQRRTGHPREALVAPVLAVQGEI